MESPLLLFFFSRFFLWKGGAIQETYFKPCGCFIHYNTMHMICKTYIRMPVGMHIIIRYLDRQWCVFGRLLNPSMFLLYLPTSYINLCVSLTSLLYVFACVKCYFLNCVCASLILYVLVLALLAAASGINNLPLFSFEKIYSCLP